MADPKRSRKAPGSLVEIMGPEDVRKVFLPHLEREIQPLFRLIAEVSRQEGVPSREVCFHLQREVDRVESFLDDFGAANNRMMFFFRELVGSMRWLNVAIFQAVHIYVRFENYNLNYLPEDRRALTRDIEKAVALYIEGFVNLGSELRREAREIGVAERDGGRAGGRAPAVIERRILPPDIDENVVKNRNERVIEILVKFIQTTEDFRRTFGRDGSAAEISEEGLEAYRSTFHRLQALYDSYLKNTDAEAEIPDLRRVRGHVSVALHLLEIGRALIHFIERHGKQIRKYQRIRKYQAVRKLSDLVDGARIRNNIKSFVIGNCLELNARGEDATRAVFAAVGVSPEEYLLASATLIVPKYRIEDFHIRPVMPLTQIANRFRGDTLLYFNRKKYDMKSALEMAIAIPDVREALEQENAALVIQGPQRFVEETAAFLGERCGAFRKDVPGAVLETQSERLDKAGREG